MDKTVKLTAVIAGVVVALAMVVVLVMRLNSAPAAGPLITADELIPPTASGSAPIKPGEIPAAERAVMERESQGVELPAPK